MRRFPHWRLKTSLTTLEAKVVSCDQAPLREHALQVKDSRNLAGMSLSEYVRFHVCVRWPPLLPATAVSVFFCCGLAQVLQSKVDGVWTQAGNSNVVAIVDLCPYS